MKSHFTKEFVLLALIDPGTAPLPTSELSSIATPSTSPLSPRLLSSHISSDREASRPQAAKCASDSTTSRTLGAPNARVRYPATSVRSPTWSALSYTARAQHYLKRQARKLAYIIPRFYNFQTMGQDPRIHWCSLLHAVFARIGRKTKLKVILVVLALYVFIWFQAPFFRWWYVKPDLTSGRKFVIVLGSNVGGGVSEWKGAREWAAEHDSVRNKKKYSAQWGYELEVVDMRNQKKYAHEWRESWEKVDFIRDAFKKYPEAEWVWWLDINTFIMEPSYSLQTHIFDQLEKVMYRDINHYNPLRIPHPFTDPYLDAVDRSPVGDGRAESVNLLLTQDCIGFNLGSFLIRRSEWTDRLLDVWWDPVAYEQKHMEWAHKEQDAFEELYTTQPWIRSHTGFLPQRMLNSFPPGACRENGPSSNVHYDVQDRDFVVNMAGCQWGRDCWGEMFQYRELSHRLNRNLWEWFREDILTRAWLILTGRTGQEIL